MKNILILSAVLAAVFSQQVFSQPPMTQSPDEAQIVTTDIDNFLEALEKTTAGGNNAAVFKTLYFDRGSPGLKEYVRRFRLNPAQLAEAVEKHRDSYENLKNFRKNQSEFDSIFRKDLQKLKEIYTRALFAPTYLLVGAYRGIGQASAVGQLVTVETSTKNVERISTLAIHEVTHFQQAVAIGPDKYQALYSQPNNLLGLVLREGTADFVTYRLVAENRRPYSRLRHLEKNEIELWERFKDDLTTQDQKLWLEASFDDSDGGYSYMLGYPLGYKIVAAYYENAEDKSRALEEILAITDPQSFLAKSGYSPKISSLEKELRFGKPAKDAPPEIQDYKELIGISDCKSVSRSANTDWGEPVDMVWTFRYELGGTAVRDETKRADGFRAGSIRQYNADDKSWYVHYYSKNGQPSTLPSWKGGREGNKIELLTEQKAPNGTDGYYRIRFYDISETGFKWLGSWTSTDGSFVFDTWKIECTKRAL
ncbi:MAG: hypothetical protein DWQ47_10495 [Acidobacteria bacterium]|mgnify:CR=1 FL=1|nr:MAG: hypothetical protein DWQ32_12910 [Acidobacteriota bacterium]REJ98014.1 MAG: hypothetical protein DWQ38_15710 [Acidobacteriota bacterium]REK16757.1 MAG: hypothetical protein DWQ43_00755 [Acidobacteriota bacterium]REK42668.1 MAG: hypothetical protein DWQ47_10495 [Acidobacteriota bacterium]